jgi:hypothetical protein
MVDKDIVQGKNAGLQEPVSIKLDALIKRVGEYVNLEGDTTTKKKKEKKKKKKSLTTLIFGAFFAKKNAPNEIATLY